MKTMTFKKSRELRTERNKSILKRMDEGDNLTSYNSTASWFPPRPVIKKDEKAIQSLYGVHTDKRLKQAFDHMIATGELPAEEKNDETPFKQA